MNPLEVLKIPRLKLAGTYLLIIMVMSAVFSFAIFNISDRELQNQRQLKVPKNIPIEFADEFNLLRDLRYKEAKSNLRERLIVFNMFVFIFGAILSYALALRALQPIEEALESQNRFTSDASHEIRTPLTVMKSELEVALRDKGLKLTDAKDILESNLEEVKKLEALTNGLLQLARQESKDISKEFVPVTKLIDDALLQINPRAKLKNIKIDTGNFAVFDAYVEPQTFSQAIVTVLDNAVKYSPDKSTIEIQAKSSRSSHHITIQDHGPGIEKQDLPNIFERFYRADKARTKTSEQDGYGLGLAIAKQIIESHGGEIEIQSKKDKGTKVEITVPKK